MKYTALFNRISDCIPIEPQDFELIKSLFNCKPVIKGNYLIEAGKPTDEVFFILSGYLRYFKVIDSGEELIIHLYAPGNFATALGSFFLGQKPEESLQAVTDCEILSLSKTDLEKLYAINAKWHIFVRKLLESGLMEKEERVIDQLTLTAQDKYLKLLEQQPDIIRNVPVKYIASFIGVQPESLSRIRKTN